LFIGSLSFLSFESYVVPKERSLHTTPNKKKQVWFF